MKQHVKNVLLAQALVFSTTLVYYHTPRKNECSMLRFHLGSTQHLDLVCIMSACTILWATCFEPRVKLHTNSIITLFYEEREVLSGIC